MKKVVIDGVEYVPAHTPEVKELRKDRDRFEWLLKRNAVFSFQREEHCCEYRDEVDHLMNLDAAMKESEK